MVMVDYSHKIAVPQRPPYLVARPRLTAFVEKVTEQRLLALTAPAGYGKTSLLIDWAASARLPVCWYSLDRLDVDPWTFVGYVLAALAQPFPAAFTATSELLYGASRSPFATVAASLVRELAAIEQDLILVFDDWHFVDGIADCSDLVEQILAYCPRCHVILASRSFPSVHNLMLLAARRQMIGLDEERLRFTADELLPVLEAAPTEPFASDLAQRWVDQTNGWITGILLALEVAGAAPPADTLADPRAQRRIYGFLAEQVLDRQRPEIRAFLLDAALLEDVDPLACDALRNRSDSALLLGEVLEAHLFVAEIRPGIARFHSLFREFLLERYQTVAPSQFRAMASRVGDMHLGQHQWSAAFDLFLKANDRAAAQRVVAAGGEATYLVGRLETLERWFAALWLDDLDVPLLCLKARVMLDRGDQHKADVLASLAAARASADENAMVLLLQAQIARVTGKYDTALVLAQTVLRSGANPAQQGAALRTIAISHQRLGQIALAVKELTQALETERARGDLYCVAQLQHDLGICHEELGLLQHAEQLYSLADGHWAMTGNIGLRAMTLNSKGVVQHLSGRYLDAHATLTTAAAEAQAAAIPQYEATVLASLGDLFSDLQLWEQARVAYRDARQLGGTGYLTRYLEFAEARLMIRRRQYADAARMLQAISASSGLQRAQVLLLQSSIARSQREYATARDMVDAALAALSENGTPLDYARALLTLADVVAHAMPADSSALLEALDRAIRIADQLGHDWFLVSTAIHMPEMLRRAAAAGWSRAPDWLERQQELRVASRMIDQHDRRPVLTVRTLGTDQILVDGRPITLGWSKAREVLCYLLQHPNNTTPDTLRAAIWPDDAPSRIVKDAIYALRSALPAELINMHGRQFYRLNPAAARVEYDVASFSELLKRAQHDSEARLSAIDLYGGSFLPACDSAWCKTLRGNLERSYVQALHQAAEASEQHNDYSDALGMYRRILEHEPFDELAHAGIMRCYVELSNRAAAIEHYRSLRNKLHDELGLDLDSSSEVELLYTRILNSV